MADYYKKVIYLSYLEQGNRIKGAGFMKVEALDNKWVFDMRVSGMPGLADKKYDIHAVDWKGKEYWTGSIFLHKGSGEWKESGVGFLPGTEGLPVKEIRKFVIKISDTEAIEGECQTGSPADKGGENRREEKKEFYAAEKNDKAGKNEKIEKKAKTDKSLIREKKEEAGKTPKTWMAAKAEKISEGQKKKGNREMLDENREKEMKMEEIILNDKWEQLCRMYPVVHPYEDERKYISIQPKDFVVMTGDYQHLANNSFLLHGFYNYRHIVLGREPIDEADRNQTAQGQEKEETGQKGEKKGDFFLGVPGVYYEREKMVALMFGFEAFECCGGKAEPGKFGYYLRRVKI